MSDTRVPQMPYIFIPGSSGASACLPGGRSLALGPMLSGTDFGPGQTFFVQLACTPALNYFGTGADGSLTVAANASATVPTADSSVVVKNFTSLTINVGATYTVNTRCECLLIYVSGNCQINGTLSMTARGASQACPSAINVSRFVAGDTTYFSQETNQLNFTTFISTQAGGAGGPTATANINAPGNVGSTTTNGTGGGGSGASNTGLIGSGGAGAAGTAFSGGSGGGAGGYSGAGQPGNAGTANGGAGGAAGAAGSGAGSLASGGGAGNPGGVGTSFTSGVSSPGSNGTGGTIILIVGGTLSGTGTISSNGSNGGGSVSSSGQAQGGGASGAGRVIVLAVNNPFLGTGTTQANGGLGGTATGGTTNDVGGNGGAGAITSNLVSNGFSYQNIGSASSGAVSVSSNYQMDGTNSLIDVNTGSATVTISLPPVLTYPGKVFFIRKTSSDTNSVVLSPPAGSLID